LHSLFAASRITGLAVICGPVSGGVVVRDFDEMAGYDRWAAAHPKYSGSLPTVATARGRHVYFRGPVGYFDFRDLGQYEYGDGEYRGDGRHYACLPPSIHPDGPEYKWLIQLPAGNLPEIDPVKAGLLPPEVLARWKTGNRSSNTAGTATSVPHSNTQQPQQPQHPQPTQADASRRRQLPAFAGSGRFDPRVQAAIARTLPSQTGRRNRKVFDLARELMAIPELAGAEPAQLRPIVKEWHERGLAANTIKTKDFARTWTDFITSWGRIEHPAGQGTIEAAFGEAASLPPSPRVVARAAAGRGPHDGVELVKGAVHRQGVAGRREGESGDPQGKPVPVRRRTIGDLTPAGDRAIVKADADRMMGGRQKESDGRRQKREQCIEWLTEFLSEFA
jgi:hypothetical protein